jgi:glycosyltransferase involved in cell wall biosynthesis
MIIGIDASNIRAGGGLTNLIELMNGLDVSKHQIDNIIIWAGKDTASKLPKKNFIKLISPKMLDGNILLRILWQVIFLSKEARFHNCNILFIPGGSFFGSFRPYVTISQNLLPFEIKEFFRYKKSLKFFKFIFLRWTQSYSFRKADGLIFLTKYAKSTVLENIKETSGEIKVIPHGINTRFKFTPKVQKNISLYSEKLRFRILYVSIIDQYKHQWHLIEAINKLRSKGLPLELNLVGPSYPPALKKLNRAIKKYDPQLEWIKYHGAIEYKDLNLIYASADLGVFASSCENLPIILLEKMASGLPIASSNRGPMREVLREGGLYFNPEHPDDIANTIQQYLYSEQLRKDMANKSYNLGNEYSWIRCADDTFSFIIEIANK